MGRGRGMRREGAEDFTLVSQSGISSFSAEIDSPFPPSFFLAEKITPEMLSSLITHPMLVNMTAYQPGMILVMTVT